MVDSGLPAPKESQNDAYPMYMSARIILSPSVRLTTTMCRLSLLSVPVELLSWYNNNNIYIRK